MWHKRSRGLGGDVYRILGKMEECEEEDRIQNTEDSIREWKNGMIEDWNIGEA